MSQISSLARVLCPAARIAPDALRLEAPRHEALELGVQLESQSGERGRTPIHLMQKAADMITFVSFVRYMMDVLCRSHLVVSQQISSCQLHGRASSVLPRSVNAGII